MSNPSDLLTNMVHSSVAGYGQSSRLLFDGLNSCLNKIATLLRIFTPGPDEVKYMDFIASAGVELSIAPPIRLVGCRQDESRRTGATVVLVTSCGMPIQRARPTIAGAPGRA
jgi:hypothetical protein